MLAESVKVEIVVAVCPIPENIDVILADDLAGVFLPPLEDADAPALVGGADDPGGGTVLLQVEADAAVDESIIVSVEQVAVKGVQLLPSGRVAGRGNPLSDARSSSNS